MEDTAHQHAHCFLSGVACRQRRRLRRRGRRWQRACSAGLWLANANTHAGLCFCATQVLPPQPPAGALLAAGMLSSTTAQLVSYPLGLVRTRLQVSCAHHQRTMSKSAPPAVVPMQKESISPCGAAPDLAAGAAPAPGGALPCAGSHVDSLLLHAIRVVRPMIDACEACGTPSNHT